MEVDPLEAFADSESNLAKQRVSSYQFSRNMTQAEKDLTPKAGTLDFHIDSVKPTIERSA